MSAIERKWEAANTSSSTSRLRHRGLETVLSNCIQYLRCSVMTPMSRCSSLVHTVSTISHGSMLFQPCVLMELIAMIAVDDPIFSAHQFAGNYLMPGYDPFPIYMADYPATVLGCIDQYRHSNPRLKRCSSFVLPDSRSRPSHGSASRSANGAEFSRNTTRPPIQRESEWATTSAKLVERIRMGRTVRRKCKNITVQEKKFILPIWGRKKRIISRRPHLEYLSKKK
jgi:hypothetical protein